MAKLTGQTVASSYDQLLIVDDANGISASLQAIEAGDTGGSASSLKISTSKCEVIPASNSTALFEVSQADGTAVLSVDTENARTGIGTATPGTVLHLKDEGGPRLRLEGDGTHIDVYKVNGAEKIQIENDEGQGIMTWDGANKRVGITSTSPSAVFEVAQNSSAGVTAFLLDHNDVDTVGMKIDSASTTGNILEITANALSTGSAIEIDSNCADTGARSIVNIIQNHASAANATALRVQQDSVQEAVHVIGGTALKIESASGSVDTAGAFVSMTSNNQSSSDGTFRYEDTIADQNNPSFIWNVTDTGSGSLAYNFLGGDASRLSIFQNGYIGINESSPSFRLDIQEDRASSYVARFHNNGNDDNRWGIAILAGADDGSTSSETTYLLAADGDGGTIGSLGHNTSGNFVINATSDARLKDNIKDTKIDGLGIINAVKIREFNWKRKGGLKNIAGFIAQELKDVWSPAVSGDEHGDEKTAPMSVSESSLITPMLKAIQELSAKVTALESA